ncbi:cell adhesion molecule DSCAM-like [Tachypleus tridentatus]|uniref:cell adhesion molecule DSCAM-like n=1 Tax=Tachypleus tridentatus TaxID=6853 RepID=UPI003FCF358D
MPMKVTWTKDDRYITPSYDGRYILEETAKKSMVRSVLYISDVQRNDSGLFMCHVSNMYGNSTGIFQVVVQVSTLTSFTDRTVSLQRRCLRPLVYELKIALEEV